MTKRFYWRKSQIQKTPEIKYNYKLRDKIHEEEIKAYRKMAVVVVLVFLLAGSLYLWGVPLVIGVSNFWQQLGVNGKPLLTKPSPQAEFVPPAWLEPLPVAINNLDNFKIKGSAQAGLEVRVYLNGKELKTVLTDANGNFELTTTNLTEGENQIYAKAIDSFGNESEPSNTQTINFDKTPPDLEISLPDENLNTVTQEDNHLDIKGKTEPMAIVSINDFRAIVNLEGDFSYQYPLNGGENKIKIIAADKAGNETVIERTINWEPPEGVLTPTPATSPTPTP